MDDFGGLIFIGLLFALVMGTSMGANPLVGVIVFAVVFASVCLGN